MDHFVIIWNTNPSQTHGQGYQTQSQVAPDLSSSLDRSGVSCLALPQHVQGKSRAPVLCKYAQTLPKQGARNIYQGCKFQFRKTETTFADLQVLPKITFTGGHLETNTLL